MYKPSPYPLINKIRNDIIFVMIILIGGLIMGFIVLPFIISKFEQRAYNADQQALQRAVEQHKENIFPLSQWPTLSGAVGFPVEGNIQGYQCDDSDIGEICSWLDFEKMVLTGSLTDSAVIRSADSIKNSSATNAPSGQYGWYLGETGNVYSQPAYSVDLGYP